MLEYYFTLILLVIFNNVDFSFQHSCKFAMGINAQVERRLLNEGFHRNLETTVMISSPENLYSCYVLIKESLPSGAYFDPSQLYFIREMEGLNYFIPSDVNVETMTHRSPKMAAYFFTYPYFSDLNQWTVNISVPVHFRYHRAKNGDSNDLHEKVYINHPSIHLHCDFQEQEDCGLFTNLDPCPPSGHLSCDWLPINSFSTSEAVSAEIPVGNIGMMDSVLFTTATVTCAAMLLILAAIGNKKLAV